MRTIDLLRNQNDELFHPLWLGILILISVIIIIGISCCLRRKCGSRLRNSLNRLSKRNNKKSENSSSDDKHSTISHSYNRPSTSTSKQSSSFKFYTLVRNIKTTNLEQQVSLKQQNSNEDDIQSTIELTLSPPIDTRTSEVARKFYASMRHNSQCQNSSSLDSYNNDVSLDCNIPSLTTHKFKQEESIQLFRTPRFFQSAPNTDELNISL